MSVELYSGSTSHKQKIPESMIQKKRELHLSYSQAFGVARTTDKFRPRYCAGVHYISAVLLSIAKFREYSEFRKRFIYQDFKSLNNCSFCFLFSILIVKHSVYRAAKALALASHSRAKIQRIFEIIVIFYQLFLEDWDIYRKFAAKYKS